jgi:hypothetical protein
MTEHRFGHPDDLVLHLKRLVRARKQLECDGAGADELAAHDAEIVRAHERLAREVREAGVAYPVAA